MYMGGKNMKTVKEISEITGVTVRSLQYYDKIGLLKPSKYSDAGYRLYDDKCLEKIQQILLFKELEFSLKDIKEIINLPNLDKNKVLKEQITLLELKKEHLENLILLAKGIKAMGVKNMDFSVFDTSKIDTYANEVKEKWGDTEEFKEFAEKNNKRSNEERRLMDVQFMNIFKELGEIKDSNPSSEKTQNLINKLHSFINDNFYNCKKDRLLGLGKMYAGGGDFTENIDKAGGKGTAEFVYEAIKIYCK